jgi:hypothetical protein
MVHSRTVGFLLNSLRDLEAISMRVKHIAALQQAFIDAAPVEVSRWSRVGSETQGTLVLVADNGAVAARLRQSTPRLLAVIRQRWPEITAIRIEVQVVQNSNVKKRQIRRIGATGINNLQGLAASLSDSSPLRAAISKLIDGQANMSYRKNQALQNQEGYYDEDYEKRVFEHLPAETQPPSITRKQGQGDASPDDDKD